MSDPWLKFYPTDWRSDPALRMCSLAARGLWIEMIALMHEAVPYGHLLVSGRSPTDAQLAVLVGAPSEQIPELLGELDAAGVFSRTREGVIYSRKMTRTAKKSAIARKNGKNGGNPTLCNKAQNNPSVNQTATDRDKPQKPEARSQKVREDTDVSSIDRSAKAPSFSDFWDIWPLGKISKQNAEKAFGKLSPPDRTAATASAVQWASNWRRANPQANPIHPASYLNGRRWTDEFQPSLTLIPGGPHDQSSRSPRQSSQSDTLRQQLAFAGSARRPPQPDCF